MTTTDPEFCNCGIPIADTSLAHYLACGDDGLLQDEAQCVQNVITSWADRELRTMEES